jgi:hypothetical protein
VPHICTPAWRGAPDCPDTEVTEPILVPDGVVGGDPVEGAEPVAPESTGDPVVLVGGAPGQDSMIQCEDVNRATYMHARMERRT